MEGGPCAWRRVQPDAPTVAFNDLLTDRQPDARAVPVFTRVQALKEHKYPFVILRLDTQAVVLNLEPPFRSRTLNADMDLRCHAVATCLNLLGVSTSSLVSLWSAVCTSQLFWWSLQCDPLFLAQIVVKIVVKRP